MNDETLIRLAAKAVGITLGEWVPESEYTGGFFMAHTPVVGHESRFPEYWSSQGWNPLNSYQDAFQLAIMLRFNIENRWTDAEPRLDIVYRQTKRISISAQEYDKDPYAAVCRGVTLAAAEIGKTVR